MDGNSQFQGIDKEYPQVPIPRPDVCWHVLFACQGAT